ncbi:MAG TPA: TonB family protein [Pyrinomonadaceae bacterium]|nr:TonB family protein [Pyrinomonadaceae bacterium]
MFRMFNRLCLVTLGLMVVSTAASAQSSLAKAGSAPAIAPVAENDRSRDGLIGPVRRVRTEVAKLLSAEGRQQEGKHQVVEIVAYDIKGNKIENQYFPIAGATLTGKEVYKYDEKGNISEMTMLNADGTLLSKETYKYEFDFLGNWSKMTTSVAMVDARGVTFEPTEVTYRSIMYYLDENMVRMVTPGTATTPQPAAPVTATTPVTRPEPKPVAANKQNNTKKTPMVTDLPSASTSATKLASGPVDLKVQAMSTSSEVPLVSLDSEPPPSPGPKPILKPVSGGVLNGTAILLPPPVYPESAKRMRTQGVVSVEVVLDETGKVVSATASTGPPILREAAVQAARKARFSPTKLSGQPVKVSGVINYKFALVQ